MVTHFFSLQIELELRNRLFVRHINQDTREFHSFWRCCLTTFNSKQMNELNWNFKHHHPYQCRTRSTACITRLMSSFARLRVSARTDLDIFMPYLGNTNQMYCAPSGFGRVKNAILICFYWFWNTSMADRDYIVCTRTSYQMKSFGQLYFLSQSVVIGWLGFCDNMDGRDRPEGAFSNAMVSE